MRVSFDSTDSRGSTAVGRVSGVYRSSAEIKGKDILCFRLAPASLCLPFTALNLGGTWPLPGPTLSTGSIWSSHVWLSRVHLGVLYPHPKSSYLHITVDLNLCPTGRMGVQRVCLKIYVHLQKLKHQPK